MKESRTRLQIHIDVFKCLTEIPDCKISDITRKASLSFVAANAIIENFNRLGFIECHEFVSPASKFQGMRMHYKLTDKGWVVLLKLRDLHNYVSEINFVT